MHMGTTSSYVASVYSYEKCMYMLQCTYVFCPVHKLLDCPFFKLHMQINRDTVTIVYVRIYAPCIIIVCIMHVCTCMCSYKINIVWLVLGLNIHLLHASCQQMHCFIKPL